jgi:hypothetical protein
MMSHRFQNSNSKEAGNPGSLLKWWVRIVAMLLFVLIIYIFYSSRLTKINEQPPKIEQLKHEITDTMMVIGRLTTVYPASEQYFTAERDSLAVIIDHLDDINQKLKRRFNFSDFEIQIDREKNQFEKRCRNIKRPPPPEIGIVHKTQNKRPSQNVHKNKSLANQMFTLRVQVKQPRYSSLALLRTSAINNVYEYSRLPDAINRSVRVFVEGQGDIDAYTLFLYIRHGLAAETILADSAQVAPGGGCLFKMAIPFFDSCTQKSIDIFLKSRYRPKDIYRDVINSEATIIFKQQ